MDLNKIIKENPNINITVNASDLQEFGQSIASMTAKSILENQKEKIYSRSEVIDKFQVCSATLWRWDKMGLIKGRKVGNRRYYSESEIQRIMKEKEV